MNDCDDVDFSDSPFPPWARKRKKNDDGKYVKVKKKKTDKKKKKISKFKAAMVEKKEKKKKKKKNKPGDSFTLTLTSDHVTQKPTEKRKRKKVAFDLSDVKRPKFASSSPLDVDVESQCNSDDVNSQDLFITQKTFRTPPSQTSDKTESPEETASKKNDASTQTENFFTAEMTSFLDFRRKRNEATRESLQPMDLSARRATDDGGRRRPCWRREVEEKGEEPGRRSGRSQEAKCVDTTTSSDDNDGKTDLTQGRVVQTRLNESFFFKTKGDGEKTRPESPLLKLTQGRDVGRNKRRH